MTLLYIFSKRIKGDIFVNIYVILYNKQFIFKPFSNSNMQLHPW